MKCVDAAGRKGRYLPWFREFSIQSLHVVYPLTVAKPCYSKKKIEPLTGAYSSDNFSCAKQSFKTLFSRFVSHIIVKERFTKTISNSTQLNSIEIINSKIFSVDNF